MIEQIMILEAGLLIATFSIPVYVAWVLFHTDGKDQLDNTDEIGKEKQQ